ncbi:MAG: aldo/keto reductase family protein [Bdellovibrionales bacterium]
MTVLSAHLMRGKDRLPRFFYGTAWKEDATAELTFQALSAGFRAIDTANQRKHYFEEGVGAGLARFLAENRASREDIFLQTKFTYARGQDHRKPYNEREAFTRQVADSFASSLAHLGVATLDSYLLHGPYHADEVSEQDLETWAAMEALVESGKVKFLGVSNVTASQLEGLCSNVRIPPAFVQNRCFARLGWDREVRQICAQKNVVYQGFSLLTANRAELAGPDVAEIAQLHRKSIPQIVFRFAQQLGMITLTGTSRMEHMRMDLEVYDFELNAREMQMLETLCSV